MKRALLAVDSEMLRPRLHTILNEIAGVETVHDVSDVRLVAKEVHDFEPDVVVLSLLEPDHSSTRLASILRAENPKLILIALTGPFTDIEDAAWHNAGFNCVFDITIGPNQLVDYISTFVSGKSTSSHADNLYEPPPGKIGQSH